jgi:PASTA domain
VPDLTGLTEAQARDRLQEAGLVLADRTGTGRVSRQDPAAGTLTDPASAVRIVLAGEPTTGLPPVLIAVVGLLVVAAAITATLLWRGRRWRRRRWLDQHVSTRLVEPRPSRQFSTVPISDSPGVSVRLQVRSASGAQQLEEVDRARAGAHAPGHDDVRHFAGDRARG